MRIRRGASKANADDDGFEHVAEGEDGGFPLADPTFSLTPVALFSVTVDCHRCGSKGQLQRQHDLPSMSSLCSEEAFASVSFGWDSKGLYASISVDKAFERSLLPEVQKGDSVEFFIDTRDSKSAGFNNRFCHHFFFLPEVVDGRQAGEITRFRTEDVHEWCDHQELRVAVKLLADAYRLDVMIPTHCLHGYDPEQFDRLGFSYRINRAGGEPQHFAVCTRDFQIEQQPSLWASMRLVG